MGHRLPLLLATTITIIASTLTSLDIERQEATGYSVLGTHTCFQEKLNHGKCFRVQKS